MLLYKYRSIDTKNESDLPKVDSLNALFTCNAFFSSRKCFNDPFDSKIELVPPMPSQFELWYQMKDKTRVNEFVNAGLYTPKGHRFICGFETDLNKMIDSYPIYSLSKHCDSILLWSHYASSHKGFCIEFEFEQDKSPSEVIYKEHIESLNMVDLFKHNSELLTGEESNELGENIHKALHVKLDAWSYEGEYRWIAPNKMGKFPEGEMSLSLPYPSSWVKSIIFGCRMEPNVKKYIIDNIPFTAIFKQAVELKDSIGIVSFDENIHLNV